MKKTLALMALLLSSAAFAANLDVECESGLAFSVDSDSKTINFIDASVINDAAGSAVVAEGESIAADIKSYELFFEYDMDLACKMEQIRMTGNEDVKFNLTCRTWRNPNFLTNAAEVCKISNN